jgi:hypothetical protein
MLPLRPKTMVEQIKRVKGSSRTVIKDGGEHEAVIYATISQLYVNPEQLTFHFGRHNLENADEALGVAKVYVSLSHAKRLSLVLPDLISRFEEIFGEINPDPARVGKETLEQLEQIPEEMP